MAKRAAVRQSQQFCIEVRATTHAANRQRALTRERVRRIRVNEKAGLAAYTVRINGDVLDAMVRWGWINDADTFDAQKVGNAISEGLTEATANDTLKMP